MIEHPAAATVALPIAVYLLAKGAEWVVLSSANIARRFGLSDHVIGLTVVALGTSAPEFVVTVMAALQGHAAISIGNVVGSNIFNTGLVLGVCVFLWRVPTSVGLSRRDVPLLFVGTAAALFFLRDHQLDRLEGLFLFVSLGVYLAYLIRRGRPAGLVTEEEVPREPGNARDLPLLLLGLVCVCGGAQLLVESSVYAGRALGVSEWLIGVTVVAAGTSLPEFATSIAAGRHGHHGIILGSLVGSDLFNLLGVLGVAALIRPLDAGPEALNGLGMMLFAVLVLWLVVVRTAHVARGAGALLVAVAIARWLFSANGWPVSP